MKSFAKQLKFAGLALALASSSALASVTFDPVTGIGFVGKGDVQYTFGLNNHAMQAASPTTQFRWTSSVVSEQSWVCTRENNNNDVVQVRKTTTTTASEGIFDTEARLKNQFTGFSLLGWNGALTTSVTSEGQELDTCPAVGNPENPQFILTTPAGDPQVVGESELLEVSINAGATWVPLQSPPL